MVEAGDVSDLRGEGKVVRILEAPKAMREPDEL